MSRTQIESPYMQWAKLHPAARFNLTSSGIANYPLSELPVELAQLELTDSSPYGYPPLIERLAKKSGVAPECVVSINGGTSLANNLAIAATTEPGDDVLLETPGYELLDSTARFFGLNLIHFQRRFEDAYPLDPDEIERRLTPRTRLIVITNLHNPSGVLADNDTLRTLGELAKKHGARVLVDEVYLDLLFDQMPPSSFHLDSETFVVTTSLTKAYGLSGLRCGWILAEPGLAHRIWRIHDVYASTPVHIAERLSVIALDHLPRIAARARALLDANRPALEEFLGSRNDLDVVPAPFSTVVFPRLKQGSVERLDALARETYETGFVPGRFFGSPDHLRLGIGGDPAATGEALQRLARALDELHE